MRAWHPMLFFVMSVTTAWPAETSSTPPPESSISAAKRELDAIKAARNPAAPEQKTSLPQFDAPELQLVKPKSRPLTQRERATKEQLEAERKSKNWLLDAMEKEKKRDAAARDGGKQRTELESERVLAARDELRADDTEIDLETSETVTRRDAETANEDNRRRERETETPANNPLANFMADWMTPQDFALLQPKLGAIGAGGGILPEGGAAPVAGQAIFGPTSNHSAEITPGLFGGAPASGVALPRENPYLQSLVSSAHVDALFTPTPPVTSPPSPPAGGSSVFAPAPPPEAAPARSKIPDFAKPATEDKYFKQLKRF